MSHSKYFTFNTARRPVLKGLAGVGQDRRIAGYSSSFHQGLAMLSMAIIVTLGWVDVCATGVLNTKTDEMKERADGRKARGASVENTAEPVMARRTDGKIARGAPVEFIQKPENVAPPEKRRRDWDR